MTRSNCLLAVDAGNTNVVFGLFQGHDLLKTWRMATLIARTSEEYTAVRHGCMERLGIDSNQIFNIMVASVVPPLDLPLTQAFKEWIQVHPDFVRPGLKTGLPIHYDPPQDVGADRIVNAVAAKELYGSPAVVVDFGTATTFEIGRAHV